MITTRQITAEFFDFDGTPLEAVRIEIELNGLGNSTGGAVAPGYMSYVSDSAGRAVFNLWQNDDTLSDTYYEVTSYHPRTGVKIHNRDIFKVGDSDAYLKYLLNTAAARVNANDVLVAQVAADRSAAEAARDSAQALRDQVQVLRDEIVALLAVPQIPDQNITIPVGVSRIIYLGPGTFNNAPVAYSSASPNLSIAHNIATYSGPLGQETVVVTATTNGRSSSSVLNITVAAPVAEYTLQNVQVV